MRVKPKRGGAYNRAAMSTRDKPVRSLPVIAPAEVAVSYVRTFDRHRCDLMGIGLAEQHDPRAYQWDNRGRSPGVLLQLTLEGEGEFADARRAVRVRAGEGFVVELPSATRYGLPPTAGARWRFLWAMMSGDAVTDHARRIMAMQGHVLRLGRASAVTAQLGDLHRRIVGGRGLDELTINVEVHRLMLELQRAVATPGSAMPEEVAASVQRIAERFADPRLDVDELADVAGYSRYHFSRLFKQHVGVSPYQHLLRVRMQRALELLSGTDLPVKRIAAMVGFNDVSWFCSAFRRHVKATPASVRRQRRRLAVQEVVTV